MLRIRIVYRMDLKEKTIPAMDGIPFLSQPIWNYKAMDAPLYGYGLSVGRDRGGHASRHPADLQSNRMLCTVFFYPGADEKEKATAYL